MNSAQLFDLFILLPLIGVICFMVFVSDFLGTKPGNKTVDRDKDHTL